MTSFWLAIVLPLIYFPLIAVANVTDITPSQVLLLIGFHAVTLAFGYRHRPDGE